MTCLPCVCGHQRKTKPRLKFTINKTEAATETREKQEKKTNRMITIKLLYVRMIVFNRNQTIYVTTHTQSKDMMQTKKIPAEMISLN